MTEFKGDIFPFSTERTHTPLLFTRALHDAHIPLNQPQIMLLEECWKTFAKEDLQWVKAHSVNVATVAQTMAQAYSTVGFSEQEIAEITLAGLLHDIGKTHRIFYPNLNKNGLLTPEERIQIQKHADYGRNMAKALGIPERIYQLFSPHHEILQENPYPRKNGNNGNHSGEERRMPIDPKVYCGQLLIALADQIEAAMSPTRPRSPDHHPKTPGEIFEQLRANKNLKDIPDAILQIGINRCVALQEKQQVIQGKAIFEGSSN